MSFDDALTSDLENIKKVTDKISSQQLLTKFAENDELAIFTVKYYLELLGNAVYNAFISFLPKDGIVL